MADANRSDAANPTGDDAPPPTQDRAPDARREVAAAAWRWGKRALRVILPALILWIVWRELKHINVQEARARLAEARAGWLALAALATACGLASMGLYDAFAFPATPSLPRARRYRLGVLFFAWTNFLTLGPLGGPALRLYFYRREGMAGRDVIRGMGGLYAGFLGGLCAWSLAALAPLGDGAAPLLARVVIAFALAPVVASLAGRAARRFQKEPDAAGPRLPLGRIGLVGAADWGFLLAAFYLAGRSLGVDLSSETTIRSVFLGQLAGIVGMTPGGLGSADAVWLKMLVGAGVGAPLAAAHVVVFRLIFYVGPWVCSLLALYLMLASRWAHAVRWQRRILAGALLVNAGFLLASAATPAVASRLHALERLLPVDAIEASHAVAVAAALLMLFLSQGVLKGYRSAFLFTAAALSASIVAHVLKAGDYEEAGVSGALLLMLIGARRAFTRRGRIPIGWELAAAASLGAFAFFLLVGFTSFHRPLTHQGLGELLTTFEARAEASRFVRGALLLGAFGLAFAIRQAAMPVKQVVIAPPDEIDRAIAFLSAHAERAAPLTIACADKAVWWWRPDPNREPRGLAVYQRHADNMVVFADPVLASDAKGEPPTADDEKDFLDALHRYADEEDLDLVFYQITPHWMSRLHDFGCTFFKLGEEAVMDVRAFGLAGGGSKSFRKILSRCDAAGFTFAVLDPPHSPDLIAQAREISDQWLREKGAREMQFSLGYFSEAYLRRGPLGCAFGPDGRLAGFVNLLRARPGAEVTFDLMRCRSRVVDNLMDFIIIHAALWASSQGYSAFSLGMSPLMDVGERRRASITERLARLAFEHGERIYNYRGLHHYKEKFHPDWEPRFMAYQKPWDWAPTVIATTALIKATSREARARIRAARIAP